MKPNNLLALEIVHRFVPHSIKVSHENMDWLQDMADAFTAALDARDAEHAKAEQEITYQSSHGPIVVKADPSLKPDEWRFELGRIEPAPASGVPEHVIETLKNFERMTCKLIVREDEEPQIKLFVDNVPTVSVFAGETLDIGFEARECLRKLGVV